MKLKIQKTVKEAVGNRPNCSNTEENKGGKNAGNRFERDRAKWEEMASLESEKWNVKNEILTLTVISNRHPVVTSQKPTNGLALKRGPQRSLWKVLELSGFYFQNKNI